ncbi:MULTISPECIES: nSTAND3 domain-containing NTPase [Aliarcobacter]|nr:restriction endonuclease [Aliarcobacter butzleri]
MIDYDFSTLNDKEFENLSIELISIDKGKKFERFKQGKDGGIDGKFSDDGKQEIIQCKHYLKTGFNGLISSLKKKNNGINEIDKVKNLNPTRYIFVTSLPLSSENKELIKELFKPYIKNDSDIYGQEKLNDILSNNSNIEKKYYKLWISSTVVLERIINNAIETRSEFLLEDIKEKLKYYVATENYYSGIEKLEKSNVIIIAGEPGIGKTTLAENLSLYYMAQDFKLYDIDNINDAFSVFNKEEKQVFYFDDFLGENYLNAIENKQATNIVKFMNNIKKDKTKRFILTSRTNIFNQGLALSDTFRSKNIENEEFIIKIESLKDIDKAYILYNHVWNSDLDEQFVDEIYFDKRYTEIISHKNFNPRLIEYITDMKKIQIEQIQAKDYWKYILDKLNNPQDVWKRTFDNQSDEFIRIIVMLVVFNGNKIEENKLKNAYYEYIKSINLQNNSLTSKEFDNIIPKVVKYFLNRFYNTKKCEFFYTLFNPSIADFVIKNHSNKFLQACLSLESLESIKELPYFYEKNKIKYQDYIDILINLYNKFEIEDINENSDYFIFLVELLVKNKQISDTKKIEINFKKIVTEKIKINLARNFIELCLNFRMNLPRNKEVFNYLLTVIENDIEEINLYIKLLNFYNINDEDIISDLNEFIEDSLISILQSRLEDLEIEEVKEEDMIYQYDKEGEIVGLYDFNLNLNGFLEEYIYEIDDYYGKNISERNITYNIDMQTVKDFFIQTFSLKNGFYTRIKPTYKDKFEEIDDLFYR